MNRLYFVVRSIVYFLIISINTLAHANLSMCSLNCANVQPKELQALCLTNCIDRGIDEKLDRANSSVDERWRIILGDTDARLSKTIDEANKILSDADSKVKGNMNTANDMITSQLNRVDQIADDKISQIGSLFSTSHINKIGIALASGMAIGETLTNGLLGAVESGISSIISAIEELITNKKQKAALIENFIEAEKDFDKLLLERDKSLSMVEESLSFLSLYNGISSISGITPSADRQSYLLQRSELRKEYELLNRIKDDSLGQENDCWVQADLKQGKIKTLLETIDKVIAMLPENSSNIDPREQICESLFDKISRQIELENKIQIARSALIQGHFVMKEAKLEEYKRRASLFRNNDKFSEDAIKAAINAAAANKTQGHDIRAIIRAMRESQSDIVKLLEKSSHDLGISINDVVIGFMFDDFKVTRLIMEQMCFNAPLRCKTLGVDDKRKRALWALDDLATQCQKINDPTKHCSATSSGIRVNCDISDKINIVLENVEEAMSLGMLTEYIRVAPGTKMNKDSHHFKALVNSADDI